MRIALAVTEFPSASQTFVLDHACALIERGHTVTLHALKVGNLREAHASIEKFDLLNRSRYAPPKSLSSHPLINLLWLIQKSWRDLFIHPVLTTKFLCDSGGYRVDRLRRCLSLWADGQNYDLIHAHSGYNGERLLPLYETGYLSAPLVVTFHGHDVFGYLQGRPSAHYQALFARASALVVCSDFMRARLLELGAPLQKLQVIPNAVQADQIPFLKRTKVRGESVRLLSIGRLVPVKGLHNLIDALTQECLHGLEWQAHIVGDGPLRDALMTQVLNAGLGDRVVFHGACSREQVLSLIDHSDLYVAPAIIDANGHAETQGIAILEAMASGLPVIASSVGGIPETLGTAAAALIPPGDADALAAALHNLLLRPESWAALGRAGRERVERHYDRQTWINSLEALYIQSARN